MSAPRTPSRWLRVAKAALVVMIAIISVPFLIVALFGAAGGRR